MPTSAARRALRGYKGIGKMKTLFGAVIAALLLAMPANAQTTTTSYTITITVTPAVMSVNLSNTSVASVGPANAGTVVGAVSATTNPVGGTLTAPIVLGGADGAKFALTNGGMLPCNLVVGPADVPAGSYAITLSATQ